MYSTSISAKASSATCRFFATTSATGSPTNAVSPATARMAIILARLPWAGWRTMRRIRNAGVRSSSVSTACTPGSARAVLASMLCDRCMRVRAAQERDMQQSGQADVIDKPAAALEQRRVFKTVIASPDPAALVLAAGLLNWSWPARLGDDILGRCIKRSDERIDFGAARRNWCRPEHSLHRSGKPRPSSSRRRRRGEWLCGQSNRQILDFVLAQPGHAQTIARRTNNPALPLTAKPFLRAAFDETMKDAAFLSDAKNVQADTNPASGAEIDALVASLYANAQGCRRQGRAGHDQLSKPAARTKAAGSGLAITVLKTRAAQGPRPFVDDIRLPDCCSVAFLGAARTRIACDHKHRCEHRARASRLQSVLTLDDLTPAVADAPHGTPARPRQAARELWPFRAVARARETAFVGSRLRSSWRRTGMSPEDALALIDVEYDLSSARPPIRARPACRAPTRAERIVLEYRGHLQGRLWRY